MGCVHWIGVRKLDLLEMMFFYAHAWELTQAEYEKIAKTGTGISHCPAPAVLGGFPILDNEKNWLFTARQVNYNADYLSLMKIPLLEGQPLKGDGGYLSE